MIQTKKLKLALLTIGLLLVTPVRAFATTTYTSPNYSVDQVFFGSGGSLNTTSTNYQAKSTVGELGVGNPSSNNYQAYVGFNTTSDPFLEFVVTANNIDLGYLKTSTTATANGTFYVRCWRCSGYEVDSGSPPPTQEAGAQLHTLSSPTASATGSEQFGMNLVANTSPVTFGAAPNQTTSFSHGQAASAAQNSSGGDYSIANKYSYNQGDEVAYSNSDTSSTIFTISYIFNISSTTFAGQYTFNQVLIATATY